MCCVVIGVQMRSIDYRCTVYWNGYSFSLCRLDEGDIPNKYVVSTPAVPSCVWDMHAVLLKTCYPKPTSRPLLV